MLLKAIGQAFQVHPDKFYFQPLPNITNNFLLFSRVHSEFISIFPEAEVTHKLCPCSTSTARPAECPSPRVQTSHLIPLRAKPHDFPWLTPVTGLFFQLVPTTQPSCWLLWATVP